MAKLTKTQTQALWRICQRVDKGIYAPPPGVRISTVGALVHRGLVQAHRMGYVPTREGWHWWHMTRQTNTCTAYRDLRGHSCVLYAVRSDGRVLMSDPHRLDGRFDAPGRNWKVTHASVPARAEFIGQYPAPEVEA